MDRRRALMSIGTFEPKTNIIHCVYIATVDNVDEHGGVLLLDYLFDISQVDWIRVWYDDVNEETFGATNLLSLAPGVWTIDIKVNNLTNCQGMFSSTGVSIVDFSEVDISMITNCSLMFYRCDKLIESPFDALPIKELTSGCCQYMFYGCTSLTKAPELPAPILVDECYFRMFCDCQKLNYIKMLAADISAYNCLNGWVYNVPPTGTFVKNENATWDTTPGALGISGVPAGWTVVNDGEEGENPYAFSFNIEVAKGSSWTANAEQLVQINKMLAIVTKFIGMDGGEFNQDNAPQEFDLRINGVRNFNFYCGKVNNESDVVEIFITLSDGDGVWFYNKSFPWNNPVVGRFTIYAA